MNKHFYELDKIYKSKSLYHPTDIVCRNLGKIFPLKNTLYRAIASSYKLYFLHKNKQTYDTESFYKNVFKNISVTNYSMTYFTTYQGQCNMS